MRKLPWQVRTSTSDIATSTFVTDAIGYDVCMIHTGRHYLDEMQLARLIAEAPAMLELLESLENDDGSIPEALWKEIKEVCRRAGGRRWGEK